MKGYRGNPYRDFFIMIWIVLAFCLVLSFTGIQDFRIDESDYSKLSEFFEKYPIFDEVVNYPTPMDSNAVLFFNLDKGILWSKKFINGSNCIQAYKIEPINNSPKDASNLSPKEEKAADEPKTGEILQNILDRLTKLEDRAETK